MNLKLCLFVGGILSIASCKKDVAPEDRSRAVPPAPMVQNTEPVVPPGTATGTAEVKAVPAEPKVAANREVEVPANRDVNAADKPAADQPLNDTEAAGYHKTCHFILNRMTECANDPGFKKYQTRWSKKGAPTADSKGFEKRVLAWKQEDARNASCKGWSRRPGAREHFATTAKLNTLREDAKLSCALFGQELDDDGWFPGALMAD